MDSKSSNVKIIKCCKWNLLVHDEKLLLLDSCRDLDISSLLPSSVKFLLCLSFWVSYWKSYDQNQAPEDADDLDFENPCSRSETPKTHPRRSHTKHGRKLGHSARTKNIDVMPSPDWNNSKDNWVQILKWFFTKSLKQININEREFCSQRSAWCQVKDVKTDFNCSI